MDSKRFEHLASLTDPEQIIEESQLMLADAGDVDEKASLLVGVHVAYCQLHRLQEARQVLEQLNKLDIVGLEIRLNAEFCKGAFSVMEGKYEEGLREFAELLAQRRNSFEMPEFRYLYEDIQCRRALVLFSLSRFKEALAILREVIAFSFDKPEGEQEVRFALAVCLEETGETGAAKQEYIRVVSLAINNGIGEEALFRLAVLYYKSGAFAQAKHHLEAILRDFSPVSPAVPRKVVYQTLSQTFRPLGDRASEQRYAELAKKE